MSWFPKIYIYLGTVLYCTCTLCINSKYYLNFIKVSIILLSYETEEIVLYPPELQLSQ